MPDLFDFADTLARTDGPATSAQAAAEVAPHVGGLEEYAAACVRLSPGSTAAELEQRHGTGGDRRIGKRLDGAAKRGLVRRGAARTCRVSGRSAMTWFPVEG